MFFDLIPTFSELRKHRRVAQKGELPLCKHLPRQKVEPTFHHGARLHRPLVEDGRLLKVRSHRKHRGFFASTGEGLFLRDEF